MMRRRVFLSYVSLCPRTTNVRATRFARGTFPREPANERNCEDFWKSNLQMLDETRAKWELIDRRIRKQLDLRAFEGKFHESVGCFWFLKRDRFTLRHGFACQRQRQQRSSRERLLVISMNRCRWYEARIYASHPYFTLRSSALVEHVTSIKVRQLTQRGYYK